MDITALQCFETGVDVEAVGWQWLRSGVLK